MNKVTRAASVTAGIILFTSMSLLLVGSYVLLGLWFVVIPAVLGAFVGSKRFDSTQDEFDIDEINYYVDPKIEIKDETIH